MENTFTKLYVIYWFIDCTRFMAKSLSNPVNNLSEGIHRIKCECRYYHKSGIKYKYCNCYFEFTNFKDNLKEYNFFFDENNIFSTTRFNPTMIFFKWTD